MVMVVVGQAQNMEPKLQDVGRMQDDKFGEKEKSMKIPR